MSAEVILAYVTGLNSKRRLEFQTTIQCAPVLKGIKTSNIITVFKGAWRVLKPELKDTGIICIPLFSGERTEVILLYRYDCLAELFMQREIQEFLKEQGYKKLDVASVILELRKRYEAYLLGQADFPHELGIVLDYPLEDVKGFMENDGNDYLFSGYWKVYRNPARAKALFASYDRAKEVAMSQIMKGWTLKEVASQERRQFYE